MAKIAAEVHSQGPTGTGQVFRRVGGALLASHLTCTVARIGWVRCGLEQRTGEHRRASRIAEWLIRAKRTHDGRYGSGSARAEKADDGGVRGSLGGLGSDVSLYLQ